MDDLRSWWEVPSIANFCSLFRNAFDLTDFDIEDLEEALIASEKEEGSDFILDLVFRLLNGCYGRKDISAANYDLYVKDIIKYKWEVIDNPIKDKSEFKSLTLREKVEFIHAICEYRLDAEDVVELLKGFEGDSMRVEPLGKDKDGATYWYFYGSRLYKEDALVKKEFTKEEKRALDRKRRQQLKCKRLEEKKQRNEKKHKLRELQKAEKMKLFEEIIKNENEANKGNIRRSGRLKVKNLDIHFSDTTETSSSEDSDEESDEEEDAEDMEIDQEKTENEEEVEAKQKKTTKATNPAKKGTASVKKSSSKKEILSKGTKSGGKGLSTPSKQTSTVTTPQSDSSIRRSQRLRQRDLTLLSSFAYSDSNDEDFDSGHESTASLHSEMSKFSTRSSASRSHKSTKSSRKPTVKLALTRNTNSIQSDDDRAENEEDDGIVNGKVLDTNWKETDQEKNDKVENKEETDAIVQMETSSKPCTEGTTDGHPYSESADQKIKEELVAKDDESRDSLESEPRAEIKKNEITVECGNNSHNLNNEQSPVKMEIKQEKDVLDQNPVNDCVTEIDKIEEEITKTSELDVLSQGEDIKNETNNNGRKGFKNKNKDISNVKIVKNDENTAELDDKDEKSLTKNEIKGACASPSKPTAVPTPMKSCTRWQIICQSLDDWVNLAEWFKESTVKCEKSLSKVIRDDFLPVLPEIIDAREKEKLKRIQELDENVRRSNRITQRMKDKMEQEKILAEALADEEKARIKAEDDKRLKEEQLRLEEENRHREERRIAREERGKRLSMREERSRLIAEGKEIPPELLYTCSQKYKDDEDSDDSRCDLKDDEDYQALSKVINAMKYHKDCWPFLEPVTDEQAPGYSDVIKRPMDLSKIEHKVEKREYRSTQHFLSDLRLMFNNCKRFNGQDSEFSECARSMENVLKKYVKRFIKDKPTDSYYADKDFVLGSSRGASTSADKKYRPKRAASSRALETVQRALNSNENTSSDEDDRVPVNKKPKESSIKTPAHHALLLQEMIELKRQREKKFAMSALHNHKTMSFGPEQVQIMNPQGGVMVLPKEELQPSGVLKMAATREIKWKVTPRYSEQNQQSKSLSPAVTSGPSGMVYSNFPTIVRKEPGLSIIDHTNKSGVTQPKTIRIVTTSLGHASVKETAESVKISADGYLIIGGNNSGIKVEENTKIVIQPHGLVPSGSTSVVNSAHGVLPPTGKDIVPQRVLQLSGLKSVPGLSLASAISGNTQSLPSQNYTAPSVYPNKSVTSTVQAPAVVATSSGSSLTHSASFQNIVQQLQADSQKAKMTVEMQKRLDIAQRIIMLNQQKRKLSNQNHTDEPEHKMIKMETGQNAVETASDCRSIEERLSDPNFNMETQLGSVSENVISHVNIASDILDTYYSVLNGAKTVGNVPVTVSSIVNVPPSVSPIANPNVSSAVSIPQPVTVTNSKFISSISDLIRNGSSVTSNISGDSNNKHNVANINMVVKEGPNLDEASINKLRSSLAQSVIQTVLQSRNQMQSTKLQNPEVNVNTNTANLVCNLLKTNAINRNPSDTEMTPIEALVAQSIVRNTTIQGLTNQNLVTNGSFNAATSFPNMPSQGFSALARAMQGSVNQSLTCNSNSASFARPNVQDTSINANLTSNIFAETGERKNVFDILRENQVCNDTSKIRKTANDVESSQPIETFQECKNKSNVHGVTVSQSGTVNSKVQGVTMSQSGTVNSKVQGVTMSQSGTVNFGSPLKTMSIMEALRSKLHTVKHNVQMQDSSVTSLDSVAASKKCESVAHACNPVICEPGMTGLDSYVHECSNHVGELFKVRCCTESSDSILSDQISGMSSSLILEKKYSLNETFDNFKMRHEHKNFESAETLKPEVVMTSTRRCILQGQNQNTVLCTDGLSQMTKYAEELKDQCIYEHDMYDADKIQKGSDLDMPQYGYCPISNDKDHQLQINLEHLSDNYVSKSQDSVVSNILDPDADSTIYGNWNISHFSQSHACKTLSRNQCTPSAKILMNTRNQSGRDASDSESSVNHLVKSMVSTEMPTRTIAEFTVRIFKDLPVKSVKPCDLSSQKNSGNECGALKYHLAMSKGAAMYGSQSASAIEDCDKTKIRKTRFHGNPMPTVYRLPSIVRKSSSATSLSETEIQKKQNLKETQSKPRVRRHRLKFDNKSVVYHISKSFGHLDVDGSQQNDWDRQPDTCTDTFRNISNRHTTDELVDINMSDGGHRDELIDFKSYLGCGNNLKSCFSCDDCFFSSDIFTNIKPAYLSGDGDNIAVDHEFEQLENDILELQDTYSTSTSRNVFPATFVGNASNSANVPTAVNGTGTYTAYTANLANHQPSVNADSLSNISSKNQNVLQYVFEQMSTTGMSSTGPPQSVILAPTSLMQYKGVNRQLCTKSNDISHLLNSELVNSCQSDSLLPISSPVKAGMEMMDSIHGNETDFGLTEYETFNNNGETVNDHVTFDIVNSVPNDQITLNVVNDVSNEIGSNASGYMIFNPLVNFLPTFDSFANIPTTNIENCPQGIIATDDNDANSTASYPVNDSGMNTDIS